MDSAARQAAMERERKIDLAKAALRGPGAVKTLAKNYSKSAAYITMTHAERMAFLREVADKLGSWSDVVLFADAQLKNAHPADSPAKVLEHSFEQVLTRFHHFLERANSPVGILVQDHNDTAATRLTRLARRYYATGTKYAAVPRLVETPLFVDSQLTSMVQLADLCAYAVRRFFENGEIDLFDRIYGRFDRAGKWLVGLRHFTGKNKCNCRVCKDHGRQ